MTVAPTVAVPVPTSIEEMATVYADRGPYAVGVQTLTTESGMRLEVWYPSSEAPALADATVVYDLLDEVTPEIAAAVGDEVDLTMTVEASSLAPIAADLFPVVVYSHSIAATRFLSSFLTAHLASWGIIVVAPDHSSRDLLHSLTEVVTDQPTTDTTELRDAIELLTTLNESPGSPFERHIDLDRVAALGHGAGASAAIALAKEPAIAGYVAMSVGASDNAGEPLVVPTDKPSFFLAGALDETSLPSDSRSVFEQAPKPSLYWEIDGVGHNGFTDVCTFTGGESGRVGGIIPLVEDTSFAEFLDLNPSFRVRGLDGCVSPAAPVARTQPMIRHAVTAWFLTLFGICEFPQAIDAEVAESYPVDVQIESR